MTTRLNSKRPKVKRVVPARSRTARAREIVVALVWSPHGALIELRALKHRQTLSVLVGDLFDQLAWKEAKRAAVQKRAEKSRRRKGGAA